MKVSVHGTQIPPNEALSGEIDLGSCNLFAIEIPSNFNGTQITFQSKSFDQPLPSNSSNQATVSGGSLMNNETWRNVYDSAGNELVVTVAANRIITDIPELAPLRYLRIRSGTSGTPVNQNPAQDIRVIAKE